MGTGPGLGIGSPKSDLTCWIRTNSLPDYSRVLCQIELRPVPRGPHPARRGLDVTLVQNAPIRQIVDTGSRLELWLRMGHVATKQLILNTCSDGDPPGSNPQNPGLAPSGLCAAGGKKGGGTPNHENRFIRKRHSRTSTGSPRRSVSTEGDVADDLPLETSRNVPRPMDTSEPIRDRRRPRGAGGGVSVYGFRTWSRALGVGPAPGSNPLVNTPHAHARIAPAGPRNRL